MALDALRQEGDDLVGVGAPPFHHGGVACFKGLRHGCRPPSCHSFSKSVCLSVEWLVGVMIVDSMQ